MMSLTTYKFVTVYMFKSVRSPIGFVSLQDKVLLPLVTQIKSSPLLTEEDSHVLQFSLTPDGSLDTLSCRKTPGETHRIGCVLECLYNVFYITNNDSVFLYRLMLYCMTFSLLVALLAISVSLGRGYFFVVCATVVFVFAMWTVRVLVSYMEW